MFYLFIFESIGTSELMLIGLVALIIFGPRKLPELARTVAKTMAEFRRSSDDFKNTWKQELDLEGAKKSLKSLTDFDNDNEIKNANSISRNSLSNENKIGETVMPEIKEISGDAFNSNFASEKITETNDSELVVKQSAKRDWL